MERLSMLSSNRAVVGEPAPRFNCKAIVEGRVKDVSLSSSISSSQWLILVFFPMAWSFICPTEILAFNARRSEFVSRGCNIMFASCDSEHVLKVWNATEKEEGGLGNVSIPLLSDRNHRLARDYGVLIEEEGVAQRAVIIIDPKGIIRCTNVNDANVGRSVNEVSRLLDALKFADEFGEGCPVDWQHGQRGVKMDLGWKDVEESPEVSVTSVAKVQRPMVSRASSWSTTWARPPTRPKTWTMAAAGLEGRPKGLLWTNDEAVENNSAAVGI